MTHSTHQRVDGAPVAANQHRQHLTVGFFGTSIMEHLEAFNAQLTTQADLPEIGSTVTVEGWHRRGWVHRLTLSWQAAWPQATFEIRNRSQGGVTSRQLTSIVENDRAAMSSGYDLVFLGCGINDVWRRFENRLTEAVDIDEYTAHLNTMLAQLTSYSREVIVISETPFGPIDSPDVVAKMNADLARYTEAAAHAAAAHGARFLDVWTPFTAAARHLAPSDDGHATKSLWSDGVHLTELGDTLVLHHVEQFLAKHQVLEALLDQ